MEEERWRLAVHETDKLLMRKETSSLELTEVVLRCIEVGEELEAFVTVLLLLRANRLVRRMEGLKSWV